jgi:biopolymer transport protein ExbD
MSRIRNIVLATTGLGLVLVVFLTLIGIRRAHPARYLLRGIDLPLVRGAPIDGFNWQAFMVAIDSAGVTRLREGMVSPEQLKSVLAREIAKRGPVSILWGADKACSFDHVWELTKAARDLGVWSFGFIVRDDPEGQHLWSLDFSHAPPEELAIDTNGMHTVVVSSEGWEINGQTLSLEDLGRQLDHLAGWRIDNLVQITVAGAVSQDVVAQTLGRCCRSGFRNLVVTTRRDAQPEARGYRR